MLQNKNKPCYRQNFIALLDMNIWSIQEEAERLKARFTNVNRAEFARLYEIKGKDAYIYQHITARRPITLDAALAYAKGFNVSLEEISPRLAKEVGNAVPQIRELNIHNQFKNTLNTTGNFHSDTQAVIKIMEETDAEGRLRIKLAASDVLYEYNQKKNSAAQLQLDGGLPPELVQKMMAIRDPDFASVLKTVIDSFASPDALHKQK